VCEKSYYNSPLGFNGSLNPEALHYCHLQSLFSCNVHIISSPDLSLFKKMQSSAFSIHTYFPVYTLHPCLIQLFLIFDHVIFLSAIFISTCFMTESLQRKCKLLCVHSDALSKNPHCGLGQLRARAQHEVITFFATLVCPTPIKKSKVQHTVAVLKG